MTITLEGKTFPVRASMRAWKNFEKATGCKVTGIDAEDVTKMPKLLYYFVQEGCLKQGMQFKMDVDDFLGMIDVQDLPHLCLWSKRLWAAVSKKKRKRRRTATRT